jgi:hypothetical protein
LYWRKRHLKEGDRGIAFVPIEPQERSSIAREFLKMDDRQVTVKAILPNSNDVIVHFDGEPKPPEQRYHRLRIDRLFVTKRGSLGLEDDAARPQRIAELRFVNGNNYETPVIAETHAAAEERRDARLRDFNARQAQWEREMAAEARSIQEMRQRCHESGAPPELEETILACKSVSEVHDVANRYAHVDSARVYWWKKRKHFSLSPRGHVRTGRITPISALGDKRNTSEKALEKAKNNLLTWFGFFRPDTRRMGSMRKAPPRVHAEYATEDPQSIIIRERLVDLQYGVYPLIGSATPSRNWDPIHVETMSTDEIMDAWWSIRRDDQVRRLRFLQEEYGLKDLSFAWIEKIEEIEQRGEGKDEDAPPSKDLLKQIARFGAPELIRGGRVYVRNSDSGEKLTFHLFDIPGELH